MDARAFQACSTLEFAKYSRGLRVGVRARGAEIKEAKDRRKSELEK